MDHPDLSERDLIEEIWKAYQDQQAITALVKAEEITDAISVMRWASKICGIRYGIRLQGFHRDDVAVFEPPYPPPLRSFGNDLTHRLLLFVPRHDRVRM